MRQLVFRLLFPIVATGLGQGFVVGHAQAPKSPAARPWKTPRTPDGHPDLQGNWTNGTITPIERPTGQERALTPEQMVRLEKLRTDTIERAAKPSDPDRVAPPKGGDGSVGAAGGVGGYNYLWIDAGDRVAVVNGELRSSLVIDPPNGKIPALTPEGRARIGAVMTRARQFGEYDNPENRPLAERWCSCCCRNSSATSAGRRWSRTT